MTKDQFEIALGNRLRNAEAPVPDGAWSVIQSKISTTPSSGLPQTGAPFSGTGFVIGLIVGTAMLGSLSLYTTSEKEQIAQVVEVSTEEVVSKVIVVQNVDVPIEEETQVALYNSQDEDVQKQELTGLDAKLSSQSAPGELLEAREGIVVSPIEAASVKEVQSQRKEADVKRSLASKKHVKKEDVKSNLLPLVAKIAADKTTGAAPLSVNFKNRGQGSIHYWKFGSETESYDQAPTVIFENPGIYTVSLLVENEAGEIDEDIMVIKVIEGSSIFIPNSFTPNGDGHNDTYKVASAKNIEEFHMIITNQMGKTIYESWDISGEWEFNKYAHDLKGEKYFLTYVAIGTDGKIHAENLKPIYIIY